MDEATYNQLMQTRQDVFIEKNRLAEEHKAIRLEMIAQREHLYARRGVVNPLADPPPYEEIGGSPTEDWTPVSLSATRTLKCAWADRYGVADWHTIPPNDMYPYSNPDLSYVTRVGIVPVGEACGESAGLAEYDEALITLGYETLNGQRPDAQNPSPSGATLIEEDISPSIELVSLAGDDYGDEYVWNAPNEDPPELVPAQDLPVMRLLKMAYTVTLHGITSVSSNLVDYGGCCHSLAYTSPTIGWTFAPETLLYSPPTMTRSVSVSGLTEGWTVAVPWQYQPQGWNTFPDKAELKPGATWSTVYKKIYRKGGDQLILAPPVDLSSFLP